jgi:hypothetical protein
LIQAHEERLRSIITRPSWFSYIPGSQPVTQHVIFLNSMVVGADGGEEGAGFDVQPYSPGTVIVF